MSQLRKAFREVKIPEFDGSNMSFMEFVKSFDRVAKYNQWDNDDKCYHLWDSITGNAKIKIKNMQVPQIYEILLQQLLARFHTDRSIEAYGEQFKSLSRSDDKDLETYGHTVLDLARKAFPSCTETMQNKFALDKFIESVGTANLSFWLKLMKPKTFEEAIDMSLQYELASKTYQGKPKPVTPVQVKPEGIPVFQPEKSQLNVAAAAFTSKLTESTVKKDSDIADLIRDMSSQLESITKELSDVKEKVNQRQPFRRTKIPPEKLATLTCFDCGVKGHVKWMCPKRRTVSSIAEDASFQDLN
jgi:hypothetical protein